MKFRIVLNKFKHILTKYESLVLALPFSFIAIVVTVNYTLGVAFIPNTYTRYSSYIQDLLYFILISSISLIIFKSLSSLTKVFFSIPILFYVISFLVNIILFGITSHLVSYLLHFIVLGIPSYLVGAIVAQKGREAKLLEGLNKCSFFVLPLGIHYIFMEFANTKPTGTESGYLGIYTYMTIAYMVLPFVFSWFLNLVCPEKSSYNNKRNRKITIDVLMILIFWVLILYTGTRGAILCVLFFVICISLYSFIVQHKNKIAIVLVACMMLIIFLLGSFLPQLNMTRMSRLGTLYNLVSDYELTQNEINKDKPRVIESNDHKIPEVRDNNITHNIDERSKDNDNSLQENNLPEITSGNSRIVIYTTAVREIMNNPLTGLGPLGFFYKYYPQYPHNIFLELIVECGIIGGLAVVYLIFNFFKLAILSKKKQNIMLVFLMLLGYILYFMVSGTVWKNPILLFFIGYSVFIQQKNTLGYKKHEQLNNS